jgi:hypothetical protein
MRSPRVVRRGRRPTQGGVGGGGAACGSAAAGPEVRSRASMPGFASRRRPEPCKRLEGAWQAGGERLTVASKGGRQVGVSQHGCIQKRRVPRRHGSAHCARWWCMCGWVGGWVGGWGGERGARARTHMHGEGWQSAQRKLARHKGCHKGGLDLRPQAPLLHNNVAPRQRPRRLQ